MIPVRDKDSLAKAVAGVDKDMARRRMRLLGPPKVERVQGPLGEKLYLVYSAEPIPDPPPDQEARR
jgi:hypothetical protein